MPARTNALHFVFDLLRPVGTGPPADLGHIPLEQSCNREKRRCDPEKNHWQYLHRKTPAILMDCNAHNDSTANNCNVKPSLHLLREAIAIHIEDAVQTVGAVELLTGFRQNQCTDLKELFLRFSAVLPKTLKIEFSRSSVLCLWLRPQGSKNHSHAIVAAILAMPKLTCPRKLQYTQNSTTSGCGPQRRGCE